MAEDDQQSPGGVDGYDDSTATSAEPEAGTDAGDSDARPYGPPFESKTFGGAFVWATAPGYTVTVLRVREGANVPVSTQGRVDMVAMLTGGRGVLEIRDGDDLERVELAPATPTPIDPGRRYRLIALTEVELFTVYTPQPR